MYVIMFGFFSREATAPNERKWVKHILLIATYSIDLACRMLITDLRTALKIFYLLRRSNLKNLLTTDLSAGGMLDVGPESGLPLIQASSMVVAVLLE